MFLKAVEFSNDSERDQLLHLYSIKSSDNTQKIDSVKKIFDASGASNAAREAIERYTAKSFEVLDQIDIDDDRKNVLRAFGDNLMKRTV